MPVVESGTFPRLPPAGLSTTGLVVESGTFPRPPLAGLSSTTARALAAGSGTFPLLLLEALR